MKIVRLRARAILALALCSLCALAMLKALTDYTNVLDHHQQQQQQVSGKERSPGGLGEQQEQHGGDQKRLALVESDRTPLRKFVQRRQSAAGADRSAFDDLRYQSIRNNDDADHQRQSADTKIMPNNNDQQQNGNVPPPQAPANTRLRVDGAAAAAGPGGGGMMNPPAFRPPNNGGDPSAQQNNKPVNSTGAGGGGYPVIVNGRFVPTRRIVHLDLKGAAPKLYYFEKFFQMIKKLRATGILIEWEDTFPYTGPLLEVRSGRAYSESDVRTILGWARANNLEVIPLVQTFGHLEWILKHPKFEHLREVSRFPQVICLSNPEAIDIVKLAIDQVMSLHEGADGGAEFFHMGADEAFQVGACDRCVKAIRERFGNNREKLMVNHIVTIAEYVKRKYNRRVLMWHDMLNNVDGQTMSEAKMSQLVEPVVWAYAENLNDYLTPDMWQRFSQTFPHIWGASAYKGADGPSRFYSNIPHYLNNHVSWGQQMTREYKNFRGEFRGIILTGWQRFDHFAILCELLPVGVPSLAVNLQVLLNGGDYNRRVVAQTSRILDCTSQLDVDSPGVAGYCQFPGARVYQYVQQLKMSQMNLKQTLYEDYQLRGWLSEFNIVHNYSSAWYLDQVADKVHMSLNDLQSLSRALRTELSKVFEEDTVQEFLMEYLEPDLEYLQKLLAAANRLGQIRTFPVRPFPVLGMMSSSGGSSPATSPQQQQAQGGH